MPMLPGFPRLRLDFEPPPTTTPRPHCARPDARFRTRAAPTATRARPGTNANAQIAMVLFPRWRRAVLACN
eukprot:8560005-Lingulodinium_polyedra.AAC.1